MKRWRERWRRLDNDERGFLAQMEEGTAEVIRVAWLRKMRIWLASKRPYSVAHATRAVRNERQFRPSFVRRVDKYRSFGRATPRDYLAGKKGRVVGWRKKAALAGGKEESNMGVAFGEIGVRSRNPFTRDTRRRVVAGSMRIGHGTRVRSTFPFQ